MKFKITEYNIFFIINLFSNISNYKIIKVFEFKKFYIFYKEKFIIFLLLHLKLNMFLNNISLVDIFFYNSKLNNIETNVLKQDSFFLFRLFYIYKLNIFFTIITNSYCNFFSSDNIFLNSSWMEREASEMLNLNFINKYDNRNLLLQYFDSSKPLTKNIPSIGEFDLFFNFLNNSLIKYKLINS